MSKIDLAYSGKYSEFADEIKSELKAKLADNQTIKDYSTVLDRIHANKASFKEITNR